jgi:cytochrome P450 family 49 subfamily A
MTTRRKLLSNVRKTTSLLLCPSGQRPHTTSVQSAAAADVLGTDLEEIRGIEPYSKVPGPRELPLVGNAWRFLPYIGKWIHF